MDKSVKLFDSVTDSLPVQWILIVSTTLQRKVKSYGGKCKNAECLLVHDNMQTMQVHFPFYELKCEIRTSNVT